MRPVATNMAIQGVWILLTLVGSSVLADPSLTFVEDARNGARIVSGWEAEEGTFPFQLSLRMVNSAGSVSGCGASIVHPEWAITAAHCTATRVSMIVRAGAVNLTRPYYIFETTEYYNHPLYNEGQQTVVQPNDIGVLKFNRRLEFNDKVAPIRVQCSADRHRNYAGSRLTASGWGVTWTLGFSPENLNWVYLSGTSNEECLSAYGGSPIVEPSTICARGYNDTTQSTCSGDSGGPLTVVDDDGQVTLVGVTSFVSGTGCHTNVPAGFVRPGHYHNWFLQVTGINLDWDCQEETSEESSESDSSESSSSESDSSESSSSESSSSESSSSESSSSESSSSESSSSESSSSESSSSESDSSETETTKPDSSETETTKPDSSETETTKPDSSESETTKPDSSETETTEPGSSESETTKPDSSETETTKPDSSESETTKPDSSENETYNS